MSGSVAPHPCGLDPFQVSHPDPRRVPDERPPNVAVASPSLKLADVPAVVALHLDRLGWLNAPHGSA